MAMTITKNEKKNLGVIFEYLGRHFPLDEYVVVDIETTGLNPERNVIVEFGWLRAKDGLPFEHDNFIFDWRNEEDFDYIAADYAYALSKMKERGSHVEEVDLADLCKIGKPVSECVDLMIDLFTQWDKERLPIVGHNLVGFERIFIEQFLSKYDPFFSFPYSIIDTGLIEKAIQIDELPVDPDLHPFYYFSRLSNMPVPGVYWNLDRHCIPKYGLVLDFGIDTSQTHKAVYDCLVTHFLFEKMKSLVGNGKE